MPRPNQTDQRPVIVCLAFNLTCFGDKLAIAANPIPDHLLRKPVEDRDGNGVMNRWKWLRWLLLYPLLIVGGCHMLMTGSPIPLWYIQKLDVPVQVSASTEDHLVLQDGRTITLPFIKKIPHEEPLFKAALANGIEVTSGGEAYGLLWSDRFCGNDPVAWRKLRVNLSNLSGALNPDGIDPAFIHPDWRSFLAESIRISPSEMRSSHDRGHLEILDSMKMRNVRKEIDYWAEQHKKDAGDAGRNH